MGVLDIEQNEPVFHAAWERRTFAMLMACFAAGHYSVDEFRHAIERMAPAAYLQTSYYEHWLHALETLLVEKGAISRAELGARQTELAKEAD